MREHQRLINRALWRIAARHHDTLSAQTPAGPLWELLVRVGAIVLIVAAGAALFVFLQ